MTNWFRPTTLPILPLGAPDRGFETMRVTSEFGWRERNGRPEFHTGIDIGNARSGDEVVAAADGVVLAEGWLGPPWSDPSPIGAKWTGKFFGGVMCVIGHAGATSSYAHLASTIVNAGQRVKAGQVIGYVGDTGSAKGAAHLHFEIWVNGSRIDPLPLLVSEAPLPQPEPAPETPAEREARLADEVVRLRAAKPGAWRKWVEYGGVTQDHRLQPLERITWLVSQAMFLREAPEGDLP